MGCDLYESAIPVFNFIEPLIQEGTVIYIDDYFAGFKGSPATGPARAFHEFESKSRFKFAQHMQVGGGRVLHIWTSEDSSGIRNRLELLHEEMISWLQGAGDE